MTEPLLNVQKLIS